MRAAAVALVLIVGAAVVLWYGNTLNSWVLGGLIGGLAALLLSIPISLTLFSYLSRRHEEQLQAEEQEELALVQEEEAYDYLQAPAEIYEANVPMLPSAIAREQRTTDRNLPMPSPPRLPVARQYQQYQQYQQLASAERQQLRQRANDYPPDEARQQRPAPVARGRDNSVQVHRPTPAKPPRYPGFPGYQTGSQRGYHQTMALRAARLEAAQQQYDDTGAMPYGASKRLPAVRPSQTVAKIPQTSRQLQAQQPAPSHYRPKRTVEGASVSPNGNGHRALPRPGSRPAENLSLRGQEPHTDQIDTRYPQTDQIRRTPQTGQTIRHPHLEAQPRNPDTASGSIKNPMVRRAPYMYEDDPLRQELAQQIDTTGMRRRSSRYQEHEEEE